MKAFRSPPKFSLISCIDALIDEVRRNDEFLLVEGLNDQLAIDQILQARPCAFGDFLHQLFAGILRAKQAFARIDMSRTWE